MLACGVVFGPLFYIVIQMLTRRRVPHAKITASLEKNYFISLTHRKHSLDSQ